MQTPLIFFMCLKFLILLIMPMIANISRIRDTTYGYNQCKGSFLGMALYVSYSVKYHLYH